MDLIRCPHCSMRVLLNSDMICPSCLAMVDPSCAEKTAVKADEPYASAVTTKSPAAWAGPTEPSSPLRLDSPAPEPTIRRSAHGETLAVLALLVPVVAQGVALACQVDSPRLVMALGLGTVVVTALLLAVDAAFLGTTDIHGVKHFNFAALFFGMLFLWIFFYPAAFFRRRHFGHPNLGPLALLVTGFFFAAPLLQDLARLGVVAPGVPACDRSEVIEMVDEMIRTGPMGPSVQSITGHRELSYDDTRLTRVGQCLIKTQTETITAKYRVKVVNRKTGTFQVDFDPIIPESPPSCMDRAVIAHLERQIRRDLNGPIKTIAGHKETRYDRETKTRHGRCQVTMVDWKRWDVNYKVYWLDHKAGDYQVEIEP